MNPRILRVGIGGPVGSGKSMLIERVVPVLARRNYRVCIMLQPHLVLHWLTILFTLLMCLGVISTHERED